MKISSYIFVFLIAGLLSSCGTNNKNAIELPSGKKGSSKIEQGDYKLGSGDKLKITIFDEPELSGEFEINTKGNVSYPLLGEVPAAGNSQQQLEKEISRRLRSGYLNNPKVNVEVMNFRHFFVIGEVNKPGSFPYASGYTVLNAVALGGGYTYRAKQDKVILQRNNQNYNADEQTSIKPGDIIQVEERLF